MFLLHQRSALNRMAFVLIGYHIIFCVQPLMDTLKEFVYLQTIYSKSHLHKTKSFLAMTGALIVLNQTFFYFSVMLNNNFDINLDPFTGAVGRLNFDRYIFVSVILMAFSKYGTFFPMVMILWDTFSSTPYRFLPISLWILQFGVVNIVFHEVLWRFMMPGNFTQLMISTIVIGFFGIFYAGIDLWYAKKVENVSLFEQKDVV